LKLLEKSFNFHGFIQSFIIMKTNVSVTVDADTKLFIQKVRLNMKSVSNYVSTI